MSGRISATPWHEGGILKTKRSYKHRSRISCGVREWRSNKPERDPVPAPWRPGDSVTLRALDERLAAIDAQRTVALKKPGVTV